MKTPEEREKILLRDSAVSALRKAERKMYEYASFLEVGDERTEAFECYENIRNATRIK